VAAGTEAANNNIRLAAQIFAWGQKVAQGGWSTLSGATQQTMVWCVLNSVCSRMLTPTAVAAINGASQIATRPPSLADQIPSGYGAGVQPQPGGPLVNVPISVGSGTGTSSPMTPITVPNNTGGNQVVDAKPGDNVVGGGYGAGATPVISPVVLNVNGANGGVNPALLDELVTNGVKFTPGNVVGTARSPNGQVVFLETGDSRSGLQHIIDRHAVDFGNKGISQADIPYVVMDAVSRGKLVGMSGSAPVYEVIHHGGIQHIAVGVASNGYIVRANPVSTWRPLK
jgi:hypothetical protein